MRNPVRSEADAFRFVWLTIGYFALIVAAAAINAWAGVGVFVLLTAAGVLWVVGRGGEASGARRSDETSPAGEHRILVVANETVGGRELLAELSGRARTVQARVLVVCPALSSTPRRATTDEDAAWSESKRRLDASLASLREAGIDARGEIGDGDPIQAIEDALRTFRPDEVIVSTRPPGRSSWLELGVVERARERFAVPLTHVVVDLDPDPRR
jgi:GABA permease